MKSYASMTNWVKVFTTKLEIIHTKLPTHKTQDQFFNFSVLFYGPEGKWVQLLRKYGRPLRCWIHKNIGEFQSPAHWCLEEQVRLRSTLIGRNLKNKWVSLFLLLWEQITHPVWARGSSTKLWIGPKGHMHLSKTIITGAYANDANKYIQVSPQNA